MKAQKKFWAFSVLALSWLTAALFAFGIALRRTEEHYRGMTAQHAWFEKLSPEMQKHLKENPGELSLEAAEAVERAGRPVGYATAEGHNPKYHLDHDEWVYISQHPHA